MWAVVTNPQGTTLSHELERTLQLHMGQQMWQIGLFRSSSVQTDEIVEVLEAGS